MARLSIGLIALAASLLPGVALAEPTLVSSTPQEGASAPRTNQIRLVFSEPVAVQPGGVQLVMTAMPGMENHGEMKMNAVDVRTAKDGRSVDVTAKSPFPVGTYALAWAVQSQSDKSTGSGEVTFAIQ